MSALDAAGEQLEESGFEETHRERRPAVAGAASGSCRLYLDTTVRALGKRRLRLRTAGGIAILVVMGLVWLLPKQDMRIAVDGGSLSVSSRSNDEDAVANQAGIVLEPGDDVERIDDNDLVVQRAVHTTLAVDGEVIEIRTQAQSIDELLREAGVQLTAGDSAYRNGDLVDLRAPVATSSKPTSAQDGARREAVAIEVRRGVPFTIVENGQELELRSSRATLASALSDAGVRVGPGDDIQPPLSTDMTAGLEVHIEHARPLVVTMPEGKVMLYTLAETVGSAVESGSVALPLDYRIEPSADTEIGAGLAVHVIGVSEAQVGETERIQSQTIYEPDLTLPYGRQRIVEGQDGLLHRAFEVTYEDGQAIGRELTAEWYDPQPVDTIVYYSTASEPATARLAPPASANFSDWRGLVCSYDWDCDWALAVIQCESGGNANAYNASGYVGLFQIWQGHGANLTDPATNVAAAYSLYASGGASHWPNCP